MSKIHWVGPILALVVVLAICQVSVISASISDDAKASAFVSHFNANMTFANASASYLFAEVVVNLTRIPDQTIPVDGVTDFYKVELISNGQVIGSNVRGCSIGQGLSMSQMSSISMSYGHFGTNAMEGNQKLLTWDIWYDSAHPTFTEPLSIRLSKIGYGMISGFESAFSLNLNDPIKEIQLSKVGDSYTYGDPGTYAIPTAVTPAPSVPELSWLAILPLLAATLFVALKFRRRIQ